MVPLKSVATGQKFPTSITHLRLKTLSVLAFEYYRPDPVPPVRHLNATPLHLAGVSEYLEIQKGGRVLILFVAPLRLSLKAKMKAQCKNRWILMDVQGLKNKTAALH